MAKKSHFSFTLKGKLP